MQHLGLTHCRVAGVYLQRRIRRRAPARKGCPLRGHAQVEDVVLNLPERRGRGRVVVELFRRSERKFPFREQGLHVPRRLAQRRQQFVALDAVVRRGLERLRPPSDDAFRRDVAPVLPTGTQQEQVDLHVRPGMAQHIEVGRRQHADSKEAHPPRPARRPALRHLPERIDRGHPVPRSRLVPGEPLPEPGLPVRRVAPFPVSNPVGAVKEAPVVHAGEATRQFEALAGVPIGQVAMQRAFRAVAEIAQRLEHAPAQTLRRERLLSRQRRHRLAHDRPCELRREFDALVRGYPEVLREFKGEPSSKRGMRDHDALGLERVHRIFEDALGEPRRERFQAVASVNFDTGLPTVRPSLKRRTPRRRPRRIRQGSGKRLAHRGGTRRARRRRPRREQEP